MSQLDVWQLGGPSNTTLTEIENGRVEKLTPRTARKLDAGLLWEPGSARNVWNGGEPVDARGQQQEYHHLGVAWLREQIDQAEIPAALRSRLLDVLGSTEGRRGA